MAYAFIIGFVLCFIGLESQLFTRMIKQLPVLNINSHMERQ